MVYRLTGNEKFSGDFGLRDQARRAAVSLRANIAEGFDSRSNSEFIQILYCALMSASELHNHFYIAQDQGYVSESVWRVLRRSKEGKEYDVPVYRLPPHS
jgi:four helix bundle protein